MSKRNREKRLAPRPAEPAPRRRPYWLLIAAAVGVLLAASFVVPGLIDNGKTVAGDSSLAGDGPDVGASIQFAEQDVRSGAEISSRTLRGSRALLFFSEGIMCQACFVQIRDIEKLRSELERRGIRLVSIMPDSPQTVREAIAAYGIASPMIADDDRTMSRAFDTLGQGMHADTPGHAFVLLDKQGKVIWQRDYWLAPYRTMYVEPATLLDDLAEATSAS